MNCCKRDIQIDIFARAKPGEYSMIGEIKNREKEKFSVDEAVRFREKADILVELEKVEKAALFVVSTAGFAKDALNDFEKHGIAWSDDDRWMAEAAIQ